MYYRVQDITRGDTGDNISAVVSCDPGDLAIAGSVSMVSGEFEDLRMWQNQPWNPPADGQPAASGWAFAADNAGGSVITYRGFVTCVDVS
jgi:hypothetical protein